MPRTRPRLGPQPRMARMNILFLHPNFPAQFRHMAAAFGSNKQHRVVFATMNERPEWKIPGVEKAVFGLKKGPDEGTPFMTRHFTEALMKGEAFYVLAKDMAKRGFTPDIVVGHSGWGTTMFVKDAFPKIPFVCFFEWYYRAFGSDADFDPSEPLTERTLLHIRAKNAPILIDLAACDMGYSPTHWQKAQFPREFHGKIAVRHDGIDTTYFAPMPGQTMVLPDLDLSLEQEIVTYATRGMEPYRGFPQFMRATEILLKKRPRCHVVIAGSDRVSYGRQLPEGETYKQRMLDTLDLDMSRVHFVGSLPYGQYKRLLQASHAHIYLTRPFVLSWSMLEAMSCGCCVVASDTAPVREVVRNDVNGLLVDFFSPEQIAARVGEVLDDPDRKRAIREAARRTIVDRFDLARLLPGHLRMVVNVAQRKPPMEGVPLVPGADPQRAAT
ncbi:MAG: glycosyltransferase family 4 protein [Desulfovibrionaceae bacterium]